MRSNFEGVDFLINTEDWPDCQLHNIYEIAYTQPVVLVHPCSISHVDCVQSACRAADRSAGYDALSFDDPRCVDVCIELGDETVRSFPSQRRERASAVWGCP